MGAKVYECYRKGCHAKISIKDDVCKNDENSKHSPNDDQEDEYNNFNLAHKIKQRCQSDPNISKRTIFDEEKEAYGRDSDVKFEKLKSTMTRHKKIVLPINPTFLGEVQSYLDNKVVQDLFLSSDGSTNLCHQFISRDEFGYLLFEIENILQTLPEPAVLTSHVQCA